MTTYKTISTRCEGEFKDRGSRFIAIAAPVNSEEEFKVFQSAIRDEYSDARHHCYAFELGPEKRAYRFSDDGEPANSSGPPIHGQILANDLTNVAIIVVRYFGGVKLGVGGLINAYREAAKEALPGQGH